MSETHGSLDHVTITQEPVLAAPPAATAFTRTIRVVIYCRISSDREGAGIGVDTQEELCREKAAWLAESMHARVITVAVLKDNDISALQRRKPRRDYRRMLELIRSGAVDAVLCWHTDRLFRNLTELEEYCDTCKAFDVATETVKSGVLDMSTASGRMVAGLMGVVAKFESEHKAENIAKAAKARAYAGKKMGGPRAFGFEDDEQTPRWSEAVEIANGVALVLKGGSVGSQVASLNRRKVTTTRGREWTVTDWTRVLVRPRNAGIRTYHGEEIGRVDGETIISEAEHRAVAAILGDPSRRTTPGSAPKWLGSLIYVCDLCGDGMTHTGQTRRTNPVYRCRKRGGPGHAARDAESLDQFITLILVKRLSRPDAVTLLRKPSGEDPTKLLAEKARLRAQLDALGSAIAQGLNPMTAAKATQEIDLKIAALDARLAAAVEADPLAAVVGAENVPERWGESGLDVRRSVLRELLDVRVRQVYQGTAVGGPQDPLTGLTLAWKRGA